jgi:hypothetical protein
MSNIVTGKDNWLASKLLNIPLLVENGGCNVRRFARRASVQLLSCMESVLKAGLNARLTRTAVRSRGVCARPLNGVGLKDAYQSSKSWQRIKMPQPPEKNMWLLLRYQKAHGSLS